MIFHLKALGWIFFFLFIIMFITSVQAANFNSYHQFRADQAVRFDVKMDNFQRLKNFSKRLI